MSGLGLYRLMTAVLEPITPLVLNWRARKGKEDPARLRERRGRASVERPQGALVWLHGASVGESLSLLPLVDRIQAERPGVNMLVTSGTVTSAGLLAKRLPEGVIHQYAPVDGPLAVRRFLDHWRPDAGLFAESELWPNLIGDAHERGVKLALVSARITQHSADGWARRPAAVRRLLTSFQLILPQDKASADRLAALGATPGPLLNLKYVAAPLTCDNDQLARLRAGIVDRLCVVGASTHPGEETIIAKAMPKGALLILAIRHPARSAEVANEMRTLGRNVAVRSKGEPITAETAVYVADTLGEMGLWFRLADVVVMGGGFAEGVGGHNPLEPARLEAPIVSGKDVFNFAEVYEDMAILGGAVMVTDNGLADELSALLHDPAGRQAMSVHAQAYANAQGQAFETGWALIRELLP